MAASEMNISQAVPVSDPLRAADDPRLAAVRLAIVPVEAQAELNAACEDWVGAWGCLAVEAIRLIRHKPGRRCVIEYDVRFPNAPGGSTIRRTIIGKVRARGVDRTTPAVLSALRQAGFAGNSRDEISVPIPLGVIPRFAMWLQEKVPGQPVTRLLAGSAGPALARRIAEALAKLHAAKVAPAKRHTMEDELQILRERLPKVVGLYPGWEPRIRGVLAACEKLAAKLSPRSCCIHRDFYGAHALVDGARLWLLDFDLFCEGDPAIDVGNFIGHMIEEGLRVEHDAPGLAAAAAVLAERFGELHGDDHREAVETYTTLTLVRHIQLSTLFPERSRFTERILESCERRLGIS